MPKIVITPEIAAYIKANYLKQSGVSIAKKFGIEKGVVYRFQKNENLVIPAELKIKFRLNAFLKATKGTTNFTKEEDAFIKENYLKIPVKTMANIIGRSGSGITGALERMNLTIPQQLADERKKMGMFRKGQIPANKGKKQTEYMTAKGIENSKATRFKKGNLPHNSVGISNGDIRIRADKRGVKHKYIRVKLGIWVQLQVYNWEQKFGPVPKGYILRFVDNDTMNCAPENLELITRKEHIAKNTIHRYPEELKKTIRLISKINKKINKNKNH
ncbi:MAG: HNH endonuclease [Bacteroidetes bacterium]|nr:HNH endonuclease [Bacteroidota bacterium]